MSTHAFLGITPFRTLVLAVLLALPLAGCGKKEAAPAKASPTRAASGAPVAEPVLSVWRQNDPAGAVRQFLATDWSARPLFEPGSLLGQSEAQFKGLTEADRQTKATEITTATAELKKLAQAVAQAGRDAAAGNDLPLARKHFTALQQFGGALDSPDSLLIVQLVGRAIKKIGDAELAKVGP